MTRFLGFLAGVVVTLAVVQRTGVPGLQELPETVAEAGHRLQSMLIAEADQSVSGSHPLQEGPSDTGVSAILPAPPELGPGPEPDEATPVAGIDARDNDAGRSAEPFPLVADAPPEVLPEIPQPEQTGDFRAQELAAPDPAPQDIEGGDSHAASIWAPFRSQRSAEGFADHLRERFDMRFEVRRDAPGVYQVFLTADSESGLGDDLDRLRAAGTLARLEDNR